jgi:phage gp45-like
MSAKKSTKKKTTRGETPDKKKTLREVRELTQRARKEIARLMAQQDAGTITRKQLTCGLEEVAQDLARVNAFQFRL